MGLDHGVDATEDQVQIVKQYVASRFAKDTVKTLQLVSEDVELYSQRDGTFRGVHEMRKYLDETKIEGKWEAPAIEDGQVVVRGVVRIFYVPISVKSVFSFDAQGLICRIHTARG